MANFNKYKQNLRVVNYDQADYVQSYTTRVAKINWSDMTLTELGYWSMTTQKHINYAAKELNLTLVKRND